MYAFSMQKLHTYSSNMHTYMVLSTLRARTTSVIRMHFASLEVRARRHLSSAPHGSSIGHLHVISMVYCKILCILCILHT